jgi:hypothetical protein
MALFQKGHKLAKGGARPNSGRPTNDEKRELITLAQAIEREGLRRAEKLAKRYYEMAEADPPTMRHVVDGTRLNNGQQQPTSTTYQFIQFNNQNTVQLSPEGLPSPILVGDDLRAQEAGGNDLAPEERQGQNGVEFCHFSNVPRERR